MKFKWQASLLHSREQKWFNEYATSVLRHLHAENLKYSNYVNNDCTKYTVSLEKQPGFRLLKSKAIFFTLHHKIFWLSDKSLHSNTEFAMPALKLTRLLFFFFLIPISSFPLAVQLYFIAWHYKILSPLNPV